MASAAPDSPDARPRTAEADVVVVGFGAAGAAAAITAADAGAQVTIIEKQPHDVVSDDGRIAEVRHTPNSRMSAALIYCPHDADAAYRYQKAMNRLYGIDDVPDEMVRTWARGVVDVHRWLRGLAGGEVFELAGADGGTTAGRYGGPEFPELPGASATRRVHNPQAGWGWFACLARNVLARSVDVRYATRATELVQRAGSREVIGVRADTPAGPLFIRARRAVVLCPGGFEFDLTMQASYLRIWPFRFYGNPANTGDGVRMALQAGADLWHMNNVVGRATAWWPDAPHAFTVYPWNRAYAGGSRYRDGTPIPQFGPSYAFVFVDRDGRRFTQEIYKPHIFYWQLMHFDPVRGIFPRIPFHMVFDEKTRREGPLGGTTGATGPIRLYDWSADNSREIDKGWIRRAHTLGELAEAIEVPKRALLDSVSRWNRFCRDGKDDDFGRVAHSLVPIDTPPYYEMIQWPGGPNTLGGARRDHRAQVLAPGGEPIPRLYSAGEFGSMFGFVYEGGSNTAECIVFGRIAGAGAAAERPLPRAGLDEPARS